MSLLSGIKFIPKEKREINNINSNNNSNDKNQSYSSTKRKHHDKHKKDKKDKSKKKHKHNDKYLKYKSDSNKISNHHNANSSNSSNNSDDDSIDLQAIVKEEEEKELYEKELNKKRKDNHDLSNSNLYNGLNNSNINQNDSNDNKMKKFDPNHFRSLINALKNNNSNNDNNKVDSDNDDNGDVLSKPSVEVIEQEQRLSIDFHSNKYHDVFDNNINTNNSIHTNETIIRNPPLSNNNTVETSITNQSAASLLRERLKLNTKKAITTTITVCDSNKGNNNNNSELDYNTNVTSLDKDIIALQHKYKQIQSNKQSNTTITLSKKQLKGSKSNSITDIDVELDIKALLSKEKAGGDDMDEIYRENILRLGERYTGDDFSGRGALGNGHKAGMDEEAEIDMKMFERRKEVNQDDVLQRQIKQAIKSQQQLKHAVDTCPRCSESKLFRKDLVITKTENCMLRIKTDPDSLDIEHIEIVPISHVNSILACDEETLKEIERFQNCLRRMYEVQESAVHFYHRPHAHIDVIPIDKQLEVEAMMCFKEAFMSCDEEWAQHRKVIELTTTRPLTIAIPKHFQYLSCIWGQGVSTNTNSTANHHAGDNNQMKIGIVHPIESEASIDKDFCLDVVAGMLEFDPIRMRRKMMKRNDNTSYTQEISAITAVKTFKEHWETYDWTQYI